MLRKFGAFIVAPFPVALFQALVVNFWPKVGKGINAHPSSMFVAICLYFYVVGIVIGMPSLLVTRKVHETLKKYLLVGLFSAILPIWMVSAVMVGRGHVSVYVISYINLLFGMGGIMAGSLFWRVGIRTTPTKGLAQTFN